jgi:hypothetical protein
VYKCLQCENDFTLCGNCETAGKHPEHVVIRFVGDQVLMHFLAYFLIKWPIIDDLFIFTS